MPSRRTLSTEVGVDYVLHGQNLRWNGMRILQRHSPILPVSGPFQCYHYDNLSHFLSCLGWLTTIISIPDMGLRADESINLMIDPDAKKQAIFVAILVQTRCH